MKGKLFLRDVLVQLERRSERRREPLPAEADDGPATPPIWPPGGL